MKRNRLKIETVISLRGGEGERKRERRKEKYFPKGNSVERFDTFRYCCWPLSFYSGTAYWIVESIQNFILFLSLSLYYVILNRARKEKRLFTSKFASIVKKYNQVSNLLK